MPKTVADIFADSGDTELFRMIQNPDRFWTGIRDNTITNKELNSELGVGISIGRTVGSAGWRACLFLALARLIGDIPNPG